MSAETELGVVVAGTLIATALVAGARWVVRWWRRPVLEMYSGSGPEFDKMIGIGDAFVASVIVGKDFIGARSKKILVRETRGRSKARNVSASILDIHPPPSSYPDTLLLWGGRHRTVTIQPNGREYLPIQTVIVSYVRENEVKRTVWANIAPPILEHAPSKVEFTVQLIDDAGRKTSARFCMEGAWNDTLVFDALVGPRFDELGDLPYPSMKRAIPAVIPGLPNPLREARDHLRIPL